MVGNFRKQREYYVSLVRAMKGVLKYMPQINIIIGKDLSITKQEDVEKVQNSFSTLQYSKILSMMRNMHQEVDTCADKNEQIKAYL